MSKSMFIKIPNVDTYNRDGSMYTKEALQKAYLNYKGKSIKVDGVDKEVTDVTINDEFIIVTMK